MRSAVIVVLGGVSHFICADLLLGNTVFSVDIGEVTQARADEIAGRFMGLATDAYFGSRDDMTKAVLKAADAGKRFVDMSSSYGAVLCAICDSAREIETETTSV